MYNICHNNQASRRRMEEAQSPTARRGAGTEKHLHAPLPNIRDERLAGQRPAEK
ncbi:MAG: hypothetical protein FWG10_14490 [Eubacteriaceae bacterium]|nr:hypothetical protein [Eubacteriaceae bacterium]